MKKVNKYNLHKIKYNEFSVEDSLYFLFMFSIAIGVVGANITSGEKLQEIALLLEIFKTSTITQTFSYTFFKYMKYHILILVGGFVPNGIFLSLGVFVFKGVSLGFTGGVILVIYGFSGVIEILTSFFLPNLCFIPAYFLAMYFALEKYFRITNTNKCNINKKVTLHKNISQKQYIVLSTLLIILGCIIEIIINK